MSCDQQVADEIIKEPFSNKTKKHFKIYLPWPYFDHLEIYFWWPHFDKLWLIFLSFFIFTIFWLFQSIVRNLKWKKKPVRMVKNWRNITVFKSRQIQSTIVDCILTIYNNLYIGPADLISLTANVCLGYIKILQKMFFNAFNSIMKLFFTIV